MMVIRSEVILFHSYYSRSHRPLQLMSPYLPFTIQVCFSFTLRDLVFPVLLSLSAEKRTFPPVTWNFNLCLGLWTWYNRVKMNHHAKYLGQRSFRSTGIVRTHITDTHSRPTAVPGPQSGRCVEISWCGNAVSQLGSDAGAGGKLYGRLGKRAKAVQTRYNYALFSGHGKHCMPNHTRFN